MQIKQHLVLILLFMFIGCSETHKTLAPVVPSVKTVQVGELSKGQVRRISGKLSATTVSILSFPVGGTVSEVNVSPGDSVSEGQLLALLESRPFELAVKNARAQLNISRTQLKEKKTKYYRFKNLNEKQMLAQADLDVIAAEYGTARGNVDAAKSNLEKAQRDLTNSALSAPFPGQLAERNVDPFQEVAPGKQVFLLQSTGVMQVELLVPETMIRNVDYRQIVSVEFPTITGARLLGEVSEIGSQVQTGNAFPVKIKLASNTFDLRPGMSASVTFNFDQYLNDKEVFLIPLSALAIDVGYLQHDKEKPQQQQQKVPVYVYNPQLSIVQLRELRIGGARGNQVEVFEGLQSGDRIVVAGVPFLRDGMQVNLWDATIGLSN
ncbi:MAG: efflux RND transporter periplasmic adaptor subunit [Spongiibacteraceae bacterium]|nr:efflux RND transporter periplasmic adaptor subunit [Spongiibacteraceae bacterium]